MSSTRRQHSSIVNSIAAGPVTVLPISSRGAFEPACLPVRAGWPTDWPPAARPGCPPRLAAAAWRRVSAFRPLGAGDAAPRHHRNGGPYLGRSQRPNPRRHRPHTHTGTHTQGSISVMRGGAAAAQRGQVTGPDADVRGNATPASLAERADPVTSVAGSRRGPQGGRSPQRRAPSGPNM